MKPWMKERDLLLQQTLAFVQGVVAAKPIRIASNGPVAVSAPQFAVSSVAVSSADASSVAAAMHDDILARPATPPIFSQHILPQQVLPQQVLPQQVSSQKISPQQFLHPVSERADILKRVAAFRAHQGRLLQERETYYETVQAKIRTVLGNEMTAGRLKMQSNDKTL